MSYCCPKCKKDNGLWESVMVQGWRGVDRDLAPTSDHDIDWSTAERDGWTDPEMGCSECEWAGKRDALVTLGVDGEPLPFIHEGQARIDAA